MSRKTYQIVDPETGEVVAEKRMGLLGEARYSVPSQKGLTRVFQTAVRAYALLSLLIVVVVMLCRELLPGFAASLSGDLEWVLIFGILTAFAWGIRVLTDTTEKDERILHAKAVGTEKAFRVVDMETGIGENQTFYLVIDGESCVEADSGVVEPESAMEQLKRERAERESGGTAKAVDKIQNYHIVDPETGATIAALRRSERVLYVTEPKPKPIRIADKIGAVCLLLFWPLFLAANFAPETSRKYFLFAIALITALLVVLELTGGILSFLYKGKDKSRKDE